MTATTQPASTYQDPVTSIHQHANSEHGHSHQRHPHHRITLLPTSVIETVLTADGNYPVTFMNDDGHTTLVKMKPKQLTTIAEHARNLGLVKHEEDSTEVEYIDMDPFTNPDSPTSCQLLLAINQWSMIVPFCGYSVKEIV